MNKTTRRASFLAAALLLMSAAGCTDTLVSPKSTISEGNVFSDPASYPAFIAKIYAGLALTGQRGGAGEPDIDPAVFSDEGFSNYVRLLWNMNELPTDEAAVAWGDLSIQELNTGLWAANNAFVKGMYYRVYFQVALANEFLRQTEESKLSERGHNDPALRARIAEYRAEARFLRALSYWHGIDFFANIPLVTGPLVTPPLQATRQEVFDYIVSELNDIMDDLPPAGAATYGRANEWAARMLLAKVYLNAEVYTGQPHWTEAMSEVTAVIGSGLYSLAPVWRNNFLADNHTSPEIIFPVPSDGLRSQAYGNTTFLIHASCGGAMNSATYGHAGCWGGIRMKPEAYNNYDRTNDTARTSFFVVTGQVPMSSLTTFTDGVAAPKFTNLTSTGAPGSDGTFPDTDFPMFRLADAYLMYVECHLRGGGGVAGTALGYLNAIRQRSYGDTTGNFAALPPLDTILAERGRELMWEAHRRVDLIRFGKFTGNSYLWSWKGGPQAGTTLDGKYNLFPLPESELSANPNLQQNPGY
jgi:starch-binding outer membrane protein, SusD/RagB family